MGWTIMGAKTVPASGAEGVDVSRSMGKVYSALFFFLPSIPLPLEFYLLALPSRIALAPICPEAMIKAPDKMYLAVQNADNSNFMVESDCDWMVVRNMFASLL